METNIHLIIHNIGAVVSIVTSLGIVVFVIVNNHKKTVNIVLALTNLSVAIFVISHLIGVTISDPHLSRFILFFNLSVIFIVIFTLHTVFAIINKLNERRGIIIFIYIVGIILTIFYIIFPDSFLIDSVPKMYFPNYYNPGQFHWVMRVIFNILVPLYLYWEVIDSYKNGNKAKDSNRIKYFLYTMVFGYVVGSIPIFLVYNVLIDPAWGIWFVPIYAIPLVYGAVTYDMVDVKIIARKAFLYSLAIAVIGVLIAMINLANQFLQFYYPGFPFWAIPLLSSLVAVVIAVFVWKKLREGDLLKYEFITIATHKFRTPLTHIKWATENLTKIPMQPEGREQLDYITNANGKLIELTNLLVRVSGSSNDGYFYRFEKTDISKLTKEVLTSLVSQLQAKKIHVESYFESDLYASLDISRIRFVIQVFIENAIQYTMNQGMITVRATRVNKDVVFSVHDSGIGISAEEIPLLFTKFYRTKEAKLADTEGMGIGLFISSDTIARHHGRIWAESAGLNKGSSFFFSLPCSK